MKTTVKAQYRTPLMECIILDNEISLALESIPPIGPDEALLVFDSEILFQTPFFDI